MKRISGTVRFIDLETGFWAIIGPRGKQWRPIHMPEQLRIEGKKVEVGAILVNEGVSLFQWGTPIEIREFTT